MTPQEHILLARNNLTSAEGDLDQVHEDLSPLEKFRLQKSALVSLAQTRQETFNAQVALENQILKP